MRTGVTFSTFDLLHAGHVMMLREAKSVCDYLICGLHVDPQVERPEKNRPIQNVVERYIQLSAVKYVDEIIPYNLECELHDILLTYPIDVRIIGDDYRGRDFSGRNICQNRGIEIFYNSRDHMYSSTDLRARVYHAELSKQNNK